MVNHGALEPTKICSVGRIAGSSTRVPMATWTKAPSRTTEKSSEPHCLAVRIVAAFVAEDHEAVLALGDSKLVALDAGERLEGRTGRSPAVRAVAVRGVDEFVRNRVVDGAAQALSGKRAGACFRRACHRLLLRSAAIVEPCRLYFDSLCNRRGVRPSRLIVPTSRRAPLPARSSGDMDAVDSRGFECSYIRVCTINNDIKKGRRRT